MRGSPRSLWLSMANRAAGWWTSAAVAAVQRQQRAMLAASLKTVTGKQAEAEIPGSADLAKLTVSLLLARCYPQQCGRALRP